MWFKWPWNVRYRRLMCHFQHFKHNWEYPEMAALWSTKIVLSVESFNALLIRDEGREARLQTGYTHTHRDQVCTVNTKRKRKNNVKRRFIKEKTHQGTMWICRRSVLASSKNVRMLQWAHEHQFFPNEVLENAAWPYNNSKCCVAETRANM